MSQNSKYTRIRSENRFSLKVKRGSNMEKVNIGWAFASGGEEELEVVMNEYGHALLRYCHNILCDYHEAQDALQITFIKAYEKRATFKKDMMLSPWLYRIAYTTCIDLLRKKKLGCFLPQQQQEDFHISEEIREALLTLNGVDRALVYSRVMEKKSYEQLAKIHGKSAVTLRKRYERARKKLLEALKEQYPYYAKLEESK
jgi:RNA polymerase sigma-70 factor (ECF subfamily)